MNKTINFFIICLSFSVMAQVQLKDSLKINPEKPTTADVVRFELFDAEGCCCAAYDYDSVVQTNRGDTTIFLTFRYNYDSCMLCDCVSMGRWLTFKTGPLPAGVYGIYQVRDPCYPGKVCPRMVIIPERIGEITVGPASGVRFVGSPDKQVSRQFSENKNSVYDIRGARLDRQSSGKMPPGISVDKTGLRPAIKPR